MVGGDFGLDPVKETDLIYEGIATAAVGWNKSTVPKRN